MRLRRGGVDIFNRPTRHLNAAECGPMRADPARPRPDEAATDARALGSVMALTTADRGAMATLAA